MGVPPARIDVLHGIDAVNFDQAWLNRVDGMLANEILTRLISRDDLIRNKLAVGRHRELADVESLREAAEASPLKD